MHRRAAIPLGLVWLLTVVAMWAVTTAALAALIGMRTDHAAVGGLVGQAALSAVLACVVIGGPATAVALRVRRRRGLGPAAVTGLAVAVLILVFIWSYMAASGTALRDAWSAVIPALVVTAVQLALVFTLQGRRPALAQEEPVQAPEEPVLAPEEAGERPADED